MKNGPRGEGMTMPGLDATPMQSDNQGPPQAEGRPPADAGPAMCPKHVCRMRVTSTKKNGDTKTQYLKCPANGCTETGKQVKKELPIPKDPRVCLLCLDEKKSKKSTFHLEACTVGSSAVMIGMQCPKCGDLTTIPRPGAIRLRTKERDDYAAR